MAYIMGRQEGVLTMNKKPKIYQVDKCEDKNLKG